ncbi:MAG: metallophosphoesterase [Bacteroidaceae bacterium]|nr:metallophosphoesterase [Bacteroidaceae bacterium]
MRYSFLLILLIPCAAQAYVSWRMFQLMPFSLGWRLVVLGLMLQAFCLFFLALSPSVERLPLSLASAFYDIGTSWFIFLIYLVMLWLLLDVLRLCHVIPSSFLHHSWSGLGFVVGLMAVIFTFAWFHYNNKVCVQVDVKTSKPLSFPVDSQGSPRPFRIVMSSDWHLGYHNRRATLSRWVDMINVEQPDLILVAGDIIDHNARPLIEENMAEEFRRLQAPVYACLGNHEYYAGRSTAEDFFRESGIHLLRDSVAQVGGLSIIGRDDRTNRHRRRLSDVMAGIDKDSFTILLDHQPSNLEEAEKAGVDFQLSGHTHHGQVWPGNWLTDLLFECAYGSYERGSTRYYVSSGLGIWGAPFRIATQSEYVVLTITKE